MARRIPLKTGTLEVSGVNGSPVTFAWAALMRSVLREPRPGEGLVLDQVIRCVEAAEPIKRAIEDGSETVTLSEEQWTTLRGRLDQFPFASADAAFVEFGLAIRQAEEIT